MPKSIKKWEVMRAKGITRFILVRGVLGWGGIMFILGLLFRRQSSPLTVHWILTFAYTTAIAGVAFGWLVWVVLERKYKKFIAQRNEQTQTVGPNTSI